MIILEGPDGSGKTTLLGQLENEFGLPVNPKASDSVNGPVEDLVGWVDQDLYSWPSRSVALYDRHPLISEPVYGPVVRGHVDQRFLSRWFRSSHDRLMSGALVVWCLPPFEVVADNVCGSGEESTQSRDEKMSKHMDGVAQSLDAIWTLYGLAVQSWRGTCMVYDYTAERMMQQEERMHSLIRQHLRHWQG